MKHTRNKRTSAAILTIKQAPKMTDAGRRMIAEWLRKQAWALVKEGKSYSPKIFTARYLY